MSEAIRLVRDALGSDAIIVADQPADDGLGVRVIAAIDTPIDALGTPIGTPDSLDKLTDALAYHAVPAGLSERILAGAARAQLGAAQPFASLAAALEGVFHFAPLGTPAPGDNPIMLVGPPASGKTVTAAKLAARAVLLGRRVTLIAAEGAIGAARAGATGRLAALAMSLGAGMEEAKDRAGLARAVAAAAGGVTLIDGAGVNPYDRAEMAALKQLVETAEAEPVLMVAAGSDPDESADIAAAFATIGVRRMIASRADLARRFGAILAAAEAGGLGLAEMGVAAELADGLAPFDALTLAQRLAPESARQENTGEAITQEQHAVAS